MFQISKLITPFKSFIINKSGLGHTYCSARGQGRLINLYVCLVVCIDAKLWQAVFISCFIAKIQSPSNWPRARRQLVPTTLNCPLFVVLSHFSLSQFYFLHQQKRWDKGGGFHPRVTPHGNCCAWL